MAFDAHTNFAYSAVAVAPFPADSGTTLTVASGTGILFPATPFQATVWAAGEAPLSTNAEIVRVTNITGDVLTITRAQEGTVARSILAADQIAATITVQVITDIETAIPSTAGLLSAVKVSAGASSANLSALTFSNASGVSFGLNAGTVTASVATNYQSQGAYLTTAALSQDSSRYAGTAGAMTGGSLTVNTAGVSVALPAYLTTAMASNAATISNIKISAGASSANLSALTFSNSNGVSFGLNGSTITATVATDYQSQGNYLTTAALSQDSSKYAGTNAAMTGGSLTVNTSGVSINLPAYLTTAQPPGAYLTTAALSQDSSKYAGINGAITGGSLTVNTSGVSINLPAYLTTARASTDAIGLNTAGSNLTWTANSSGLSIDARGYAGTGTSATNASLTLNSNGLAISVAPPGAGGGPSVTLSGNTAGTLALASSGTVTWAGGNNITLSQDGNAITISGANLGGAQTGISGIIAGTQTATSGTVSFADGSGVSWGLDGQTITASVRTDYQSSGAYLTTAALSQDSSKYAGINGAITGGSLTVNTSGVSISLPAYLTTAMQSASSSVFAKTGFTSTTTAGTAIVGTHDTNGLSLGVPAFLTTAMQSASSSVFAKTGFTSTTTAGTAIVGTHDTQGLSLGVPAFLTTAMASNRGSDFVAATAAFAGTNASGTIASNGISVSVAAPGGGASLSGYAIGNTTGAASSSQVGLSSVSFSGAGNVSVGYSGSALIISGGTAAAAPVNFSAGTTSNNLGSVVFSNSNGISFGLNGSTITGSANTLAVTTVGTATSVEAVASANSVGTVTRWAAEDHRHAGIGAIGLSTSGNSAGTSGSVQGTYWLQGGNNVTISQITSNNGSHTAVFSVGAYLTTAMASNAGSNFVAATAAFNGTNASGTIASNGVSVSVAAPGGGATASYYANIDDYGGLATGASAITQTSGSSIFVQPFILPYALSGGFVRFLASFNDSGVGTAGATSANSTYSAQRVTTIAAVIYSQGSGANSRSIQSLTSTSAGITGITQYGAGAQGSRYTVTLSKIYPASGGALQTYTTSYAVSSASIVVSSESNTLFTGPRFLDVSWAGSLGPGNYWLGIGASTGSTSQSSNISFVGTIGMGLSLNAITQPVQSFGVLGAATSASDHQLFPGLGVWTTNSAILSTGSIALSQVSQVASNPQLPFQIIRSA